MLPGLLAHGARCRTTGFGLAASSGPTSHARADHENGEADTWQGPIGARRPRVMIVFGTRPEAIKIAPVAMALRSVADRFDTILCSTGQHRELLAGALSSFGLAPDLDLALMRQSQDLAALTGRVLAGVHAVYERYRPQLVLVQGDTTTAFAGALAAYYRQIPVAHLEAGLRSGERYDPFPEEVNRRLVSCLATMHFAPTIGAARRLAREGFSVRDILVTGNTVIDALLYIHRRSGVGQPLQGASGDRRILVTMHRRESYGAPFQNICRAIRSVADSHPTVEFVFPVHPAPSVREPVYRMLGAHPRVRLIEPLAYPKFVAMLSQSHFVMTDSGGVQEEAPALAKPVLILRNTTERPEAISAGTARLIGTSTEAIVEATTELLDNPAVYARMARAVNPFGDGRAANRVVDALLYRYGYARTPPEAFRGAAATEGVLGP
jgi:UDP-N-acetylglucosamine 2-epimerase (non-hydrolysing)